MGAPPQIRYQMQSQTSSISADFLKYSGHRLNLRELSDDNPNQRTLQRLGAAGRNPQRLQEEACCEGGRRAIRRVRPAAFFLFFSPFFVFPFLSLLLILKTFFGQESGIHIGAAVRSLNVKRVQGLSCTNRQRVLCSSLEIG